MVSFANRKRFSGSLPCPHLTVYSFGFSAASNHEEKILNEDDGSIGRRKMIQKILGYVNGYH